MSIRQRIRERFQSYGKRKRRCLIILFAVSVLAGILLGRPLLHVASAIWHDIEERDPLPEGFVDDASRMNMTEVKENWPVPVDPKQAERQLVRLFERAGKEGLPISIAGSRHSMGGHTFTPGGIVIDMTSFNEMELDEQENILRVQAGAKWSEVISYLDERKKSVAIMQSNNSFTVGGSISVNCHGWQYGRPPIASSVESFRLLLADGTIRRCSRTENRELFSLVLGGYGLFGVILDVDLQVVPNERYRLEQLMVPLEEALTTFDQVTTNPDVAMTYARMNIVPNQFLEEVLINVLYRDSAEGEELPKLEEPGLVAIRRGIFRGSTDSEYGKELRWQAETQLQPHLRQQHYSRNQLLNEGVEVFENRTAGYTDILHEYFVPRGGLIPFVASLRELIPKHKADLLNVTVRKIDVDEDTFLRYADRPLFSFVMLFHQARTEEGDRQMETLTVEMIEAALQVGGRYYLPYRLHATTDQFHRAYPMAHQFFEFKRKHDPQELFQNKFYHKYGLPTKKTEAVK